MEAIAVIGCIAAVVSAYHDGGAILGKIKQKRLARQAPPPTRLLEDSLARGPRAVEEAKESGIERFGPKYAVGDRIALESLKDIVIDLQSSLLRHLRQAQEDDNMTDFTTLVDASDIGRIRTVTVLNDLYMRVATSTTITQSPFGNMGHPTNPPTVIQHVQVTPDAFQQVPTSPSLLPGERNTAQPTIRRQTSLEHEETYKAVIASPTTPKSGFLNWVRRKSSAGEGNPGKSNDRSPRIRPKLEGDSGGKHHQKTWSLSPMTSPQAIDEDNPWATEGSSQAPEAREPTPEKSVSRATTLVPSIRQRPSTVSSTSSTSNIRMLSPYELHGGFCKGAYKMQVHEKDAMKLRNQSTAKTGEAYYWACGSSKCAFEGPACLLKILGKNWTFDDTVKESSGIRYRWSFLAKAHVTLAKVQKGKYDYGCVFCIYDGFECPVFHGIRDFMEHVSTHRGKSIAETMLQRIKCINDRVAGCDEEFDVNLTPLEEGLKLASDFHNGHLPQPITESDEVRDRVSWMTVDETMAHVDPWRDAT
ncbi:MAG: hypothetical protein Q9170_003670 [Blastenia crenularia]